MSRLSQLPDDRRGSSAVELALALPMLLVLMFGSFELGNYFLNEHVVQKSVRDAARYASRLPLTNYAGCNPQEPGLTQIRRVARTGQPDGTQPRIAGWTDDTMTTVNVACDTSGTYTGMYVDFPFGVPVVTVTAEVPYTSLFSIIGLGNPSLRVRATSEAAVYGA